MAMFTVIVFKIDLASLVVTSVPLFLNTHFLSMYVCAVEPHYFKLEGETKQLALVSPN